MLKCLIFILLFLCFSKLFGQELFRTPAHFKALGNASVSLQSPHAAYSNPAGFAFENKLALGVQYDNRFLLDELRTVSAFVVFPLFRTNLSFTISQFGKDVGHENKFSFAVAKKLSDQFSAAIQFHYYRLYFPENRNRSGSLIIDLGTQYQFENGFRLGFQLFNPSVVSVQTLHLKFKYPMVLRFGLNKVFEEFLLVATEVQKQSDQTLEFKSGMEFQIREQLRLRLGLEARSATFSMGVGYFLSDFQTDLTFSFHQYLGYSPSFSIYYQLP